MSKGSQLSQPPFSGVFLEFFCNNLYIHLYSRHYWCLPLPCPLNIHHLGTTESPANTFLWPQYIAQVTTQSWSQVPELMVPRSSLNQWQTAVDRQYSTFLTLRWENLGPVLHHISEAPSGIEAQMLPTITCSLTQSVWFLPFLVSFPYFHTNPYWSHLRNKLLALESLLQRVCSLVGQTALCDPGCKSLLGVIL